MSWAVMSSFINRLGLYKHSVAMSVNVGGDSHIKDWTPLNANQGYFIYLKTQLKGLFDRANVSNSI